MKTKDQAPQPPANFKDAGSSTPPTADKIPAPFTNTSSTHSEDASAEPILTNEARQAADTQGSAEPYTPAKTPRWLTVFRVVLTILILLPQPQLFFIGAMSVESHGFFGGTIFLITPFIMLIFFIDLIWHAPNRRIITRDTIVLAVCAAILVGNHFWAVRNVIDTTSYDSDMTDQLTTQTSEAGIDYEDYRPFTSTKIARLDEESTLTFGSTENLPHIDSATALLPLASAIVTATYPEAATTICFDDPEYIGPTIMYTDNEDNFILHSEDFQFNNTTWGFRYLARGGTDLFLGTKAPSEDVTFASQRGVNFNYTPIGREGFVFIVNQNNPVDSLTVQQVKDIYSGKITNWKDVGGNDEPIVAYQRNSNSGSQSTMEAFMGDTPLMAAPSTLGSSSMSGIVKRIADYDNGAGAIGYSFRYYVTDLVEENDVKILKVDGVEPTIENLCSETYPITYNFYAVTREGDVSENTQKLIDWILGPQGQELVEKSGYAPVG